LGDVHPVKCGYDIRSKGTRKRSRWEEHPGRHSTRLVACSGVSGPIADSRSAFLPEPLCRTRLCGRSYLASLCINGNGRSLSHGRSARCPRRPSNAVGWLLCVVGLAIAVETFTDKYAPYADAIGLAGTEAAAFLNSINPGVLLAIFVPLLFPDGRLPSRRWRPVL